MKTIQNVGLALLVVGLAISCKKYEQTAVEEPMTESKVNATKENADSKSVISSNAAQEPKNSNRKFIRTADIKFKVKNVPQSTYAIENATTKFGGFVINTNLQSTISDKDEVKISQDSSIVTIKYIVDNNITIRVPNTKLDTVIKTIAKQIDFLDYRVIKADDVSLQMLSNELEQNRKSNHENRLTTAIDKKGKKLNDIVSAEDDLENKKEENDNSKLENLSLNDQVNFSTLTLQLYQRQTIKQEKIANAIVFRQNIGSQILDSLATGWYFLEGIIAFVIQLWSIILIGILGWFGYKKFKNKTISI
jgi:Domain of unknown function (DUF4349)